MSTRSLTGTRPSGQARRPVYSRHIEVRRRVRIVSTAVLLIASVFVVAPGGLESPRKADAGQWTYPYYWGNGEWLGNSYTTQGNMVAMWQEFLYARYGAWGMGGCGSNCTSQGIPIIDGYWGPDTRNYTLFWQAEFHSIAPQVVADGVVGTNTWNAARYFNLGAPTFVTSNSDYYGYSDLFFQSSYPGYSIAMQYSKVFLTWLTGVISACDAWVVVSSPDISHLFYTYCE